MNRKRIAITATILSILGIYAAAHAAATALFPYGGGTGISQPSAGLIYSNGGNNAMSATTSPTVGYLTATSTTATSNFSGALQVVGNICTNVNSHCLGSALTEPNGYITIGQNSNPFFGNLGPMMLFTRQAATEWDNDNADSNSILYANDGKVIFYNDQFNDWGGRIWSGDDQMPNIVLDSGDNVGTNNGVMFNLGTLAVGSSTATDAVGPSYSKFTILEDQNGNNTSDILTVATTTDGSTYTSVMRMLAGGNLVLNSNFIANSNVSVGTSTSAWPLTVFSSTLPQLSLSAGAGKAQWVFANEGGNLYIATTTVAGTATTTPSALTILGSTGRVGVNNNSPSQPLQVNGNAIIGSDYVSSHFTIAPLSLINSASATLKTQLNMVNTGGSAGAGSAMDFYTYTNLGNNTPEARFGGLDDGNFSNNFVFYTKQQGLSGNGSLGEVVRITSTGSLGVGTTSPWGQLSASSTSANPALAIEQRSTGPAAVFLGGNVGIGSTSPTTKLSIQDANDPMITIADSDDTSRSVKIGTYTSDKPYPGIWLGQSTPTDTNYSFLGGGGLSLFNSASGQYMDFRIANASQMRVASNGFLGIGTTTPANLLQVNSTAATTTISATVTNGGARSTVLGGRIILQDSAGGTCTEITSNAGVLKSKAVTCP